MSNPKPKAVRASPDAVKERLEMPCDKRDDKGYCTAGCKTCPTLPTCHQLAAWKNCPEGKW